ncbi:hypothetical protein [Luteococcus sediminum]
MNAIDGAENRLSSGIEGLRAELDILSSKLGFPPKNFEIVEESSALIKARRRLASDASDEQELASQSMK